MITDTKVHVRRAFHLGHKCVCYWYFHCGESYTVLTKKTYKSVVKELKKRFTVVIEL